MLVAEARVVTDRPSRYLVQLCRHVQHVATLDPQMRAQVEWSDDHGVISLGGGRCRLHAEPGALVLRAEAADEASLRAVEQRVADRVARVGRREGLTVTWARFQATQREDLHMTEPPRHIDPERDRREGLPRWLKVSGIIAVLVVVLVVIVLVAFGGGGGGGHGPQRHGLADPQPVAFACGGVPQ